MSTLTTAGSMSMSMEEHSAVSVEELELGTHLPLGIAGGAAGSSRPPPPRTVLLFGKVLSLPDDDDGREPTAPPASRGKRDRGGSIGAAAARQKKARKFQATEDDGDRRSLMTTDDDDGGGRKKLRLTAAQAAMLEDSFRAHNILSHGEKQELARRVGLSARQVEVWFQNRRARTKLKQTELDCELLRRWCDRLADENGRLRRDLAELRASASARLAVCTACCGKHKQIAAAEMA